MKDIRTGVDAKKDIAGLEGGRLNGRLSMQEKQDARQVPQVIDVHAAVPSVFRALELEVAADPPRRLEVLSST